MKSFIEQWRISGAAYLRNTPPRTLYRQEIFWGTIILSSLILLLTIYHVQAIPVSIGDRIRTALETRPWVNELVVVDGRDVYLRGEIEPESGIEYEISLIRNVDGVASVTNRLVESPKLAPHMALSRNQDELQVHGRMSGEFLESTIGLLEETFPESRISDRIQIDDRLGRPLWLEGFDESLLKLSVLDEFEINGWRDLVEVSGAAPSANSRLQLGFAVPASLQSGVRVVNRLKLEVDATHPDILLISDWRGTALSGSVPSDQISRQLVDTVRDSFGVEDSDIHLNTDSGLDTNSNIDKISALLPVLSKVSGLRLESSGSGYMIFGKVDDPWTLGEILQALRDLELDEVVHSEISVSKASRNASITLFSDRERVVINGLLPTVAARKKLVDDIRQELNVQQIIDLTSIEPDVARSPWLENWNTLLASLPRTVLGVTIDDSSILVTGNVESQQIIDDVNVQLSTLFPESEQLNWLTATD